MTNAELAELIRNKFTPLVFSCGCAGSHPDCASVLERPEVWTQNDVVVRIAKLIESLGD